MNNLSIKVKLIIIASISTFGFLLTAFFVNKIIADFHSLAYSELIVERLSSNSYELRKHEKDFLSRKDLKYKDKFLKVIKELENNKKTLIKDLTAQDIKTKEIKEFTKYVNEYKDIFLQIVELQKEIGLTPEMGFYGSLRDSVHKVQESAKKSQNNKLLALVYDLRKQEKDFMLRRDLKYVEKFEKKINSLLNSDSLVQGQRRQLLLAYKKDFLTLVEMEIKKGLDSNSEMMNKMRNTVHKTEKMNQKMINKILKGIEAKFFKIKIFVFILISFSVLLVLLFSFYISKGLNDNIK